MSIRRGSQRRLGRPSAVIAGATVTDSTVSVISRRQAARRFAGSRSLSMSSGPMMLLSPPSPSRARAACASSRVLASFSKVSWLAGRPNKPSSPSCRIVSSRSALARSIASSASRICCLREARPCDVGRGRVRPDRVQHHLLDPVGLDRRSSPAAVRARVAAAVVAAVAVDHHPRGARPAAQHSQARQQPLGLGLAPARDRPPLHALVQGAILNDRLVSARVVQLAEVDLAQVHPRAQHPRHTRQRALDPVLGQTPGSPPATRPGRGA